MRSSSERIGALAAALAKAQSEITNPEKSLTATILSPFPRESSQPSATRRCQRGWTWSASVLGNMRSPRSRPPPSTGTAI